MTRAHAEIWGETPLHAAARLGNAAALDAALCARAPVEAQDVLGFTPLHVAAIEGHAEIVSSLLVAGAAVDARAKKGVTPLMLACARARLPVVERLLAAGAEPGAEGSLHLYAMLSFVARAKSLPLLQRLLAAGLPVPERFLSGYFRLLLELTGHRVRFVEPGYSRGVAGETDSVWAVDRPIHVPAPLLEPLVSATPWNAHLQAGLAAAMEASPNYAERFVVRPAAFDQEEALSDPYDWVAPYLEDVHEVRCGRRSATERADNGWSILGRAVSGTGADDAEPVGALLEASGWDLATVATETPEEAIRHEEERGLYPVHRGPLQSLAAEAIARRRAQEP
jgi:hypothetical protein